jgi:hypothetical protein
MSEIEFLFHNFEVKFKESSTKNLLMIIEKIQKYNKNPAYLEDEQTKTRLCMKIIDREQLKDKNILFLGEMIQSSKSNEFKEERKGLLNPLRLKAESAIAHQRKGVINFLICLNLNKKKCIVMLENQAFSPGINKLTDYINEIGKDEIDEISHKQILGKDFINFLRGVSNNSLTLVNFRLKKNLSTDEIKRFGLVEDAMQKLKEKELDFEIILHWGAKDKNKIRLIDFIKGFFKIEDVSDLEGVDFSELLRKFTVETDSTTFPKVDIMERMFRYKLIGEKTFYETNKRELFDKMKEFFIINLPKLIE